MMHPLRRAFIPRSPQTAALLSDHAARLQQFRFSSQELRWGQQVKKVMVPLMLQTPWFSSVVRYPGRVSCSKKCAPFVMQNSDQRTAKESLLSPNTVGISRCPATEYSRKVEGEKMQNRGPFFPSFCSTEGMLRRVACAPMGGHRAYTLSMTENQQDHHPRCAAQNT